MATFNVPVDTSILYTQQLDSGIYTFENFQKYINNNYNQYEYTLNNNNWGGKKPQQNLVLGSDFKINIEIKP